MREGMGRGPDDAAGEPAEPARQFLSRLASVQDRLRRLSAGECRAAARTDPDPGTGERWEWGQVWAHVAEFPDYWIEQIGEARAAPRDPPPPFGRVKTDPGRVAAIEADRATPVPELWARVEPQLGRVRRMIEGFTSEDWRLRVSHSTLGTLDMPRILETFLLGHLEEHARQLEGLLAT